MKTITLCAICFFVGVGASYALLLQRFDTLANNRISSERHLFNLIIGGATEFQNGNATLGNDVVTFLLRQRLGLLERLEIQQEDLSKHKQKIENYLKQFPASDCANELPENVINCHLGSTTSSNDS